MKETLILRDEQDQVLTCEILKQVMLDDMTYALITPVEVMIELLSWEEEESEANHVEDPAIDGTLEELEPQELEAVLPTARAVLAELNLNLNFSAFELMTVAGEIPAPEEEDVIEIAKEEDVEEYQLLATFYHEQKQYGVFVPLDPLLLFAAQPEDSEPYLLTPDYPETLFDRLQDKLLDLAE